MLPFVFLKLLGFILQVVMNQEPSNNDITGFVAEDSVFFTPMKIRSPPAVDPMAFLFKMKRSRKEIMSSQSLEEEIPSGDSAALSSQNEDHNESQGENQDDNQDEVAPAQDEQVAETKQMPDGSDDSNGEVVSDLFKSAELPKPEIPEDSKPSPFAASVIHPWHIVDYHLYLLQIEGKKDTTARRNGILLRDGVDCRPLSYEEMFDVDTFDPDLVGEEPSVLFAALPVPEHRVQFHGTTYVLEYDWNLRCLYARHFLWVPEDLRNVECVWTEGIIIYCVPIADIINVMKTALDERYRRIEFLSNSRCTTSYVAHDDPGMELVVAYQFCQFAVDFAEAILPDETDDAIEKFKSELMAIMEEIRLTLQRASYRAWFAVREGLSMEKFSRKVSFDRYLNDLFTYNKSIEEGSLRGKKWHAPGLNTCKRIRDTDAKNRRARNEQRLQDIFAPLEQSTRPVPQEKVFEDMLAKTDESQANSLFYEEPPQTPTSQLWWDFDTDVLETSPGSPIIVRPETPQVDDFEVTEYHHTPLQCLLDRTFDLIQKQPEFDSLENRGRFGALLTEMGACVMKDSLDECAIAPEQGLDNDDWSLEVNFVSDSEEEWQVPVRRLLPSPILD